jgi:CHAT domain-containing protein
MCVASNRESPAARFAASAALACSALLLLTGTPAEAQASGKPAGCPAMLADHLPLLEMTFDMANSQRVSRKLLLPARTEILLLARESGLDVFVEVKRDADVVARADNPIRRTGTQRALFKTGADAQYSLDIVRKKGGATPGQVQVRAIALASSVNDDPCVTANRSLAAADAQFAIGQLVTLGITSDAGADAASAYKSSADGYAAVAATLAPAGASALLAEAQHAQASALYLGVQNWEESCMAAERAGQTYRAIGSDYGAARAQALLAAALMETGPATKVTCGASPQLSGESRLARIRRLLTSAAAFHAAHGQSYDQAVALNDLGLAASIEDDFAAAMRAYEQADKLYGSIGESLKQAQVLQNIALADFEVGRVSAALPLYARALALLQPDQDPTLYAAILSNSALASTFAGEHDTALRQLSQALALSRSAQDKWWEVTILDNIGLVYGRIGDRELALDFYGQSLALGNTALISSRRKDTLAKMADILREQGNYTRALTARKEALALASSSSSRALFSIQLAADYRSTGNLAEAAKVLDTVFGDSAATLGDFLRASALLERGDLGLEQNALPAAESDYRAAVRAFHALDIPERELDASLGLARSLYRRAGADEALQELERTLQLAEELRQQSANPELRARLLATSRPVFDLKVSIIADRYFAQPQAARSSKLALEALQAAERARARALDDFTRLDMNASAAASQQLQRRQSIISELASRRERLESLLETSPPTSPRIAAVRTDIATLRQQLNDVDAQLAAASIRPSSGDVPLSIDAQAVPEDAAIIEYWLGREHALAWTITHDAVTLYDLGKSTPIDATARALHASLRSFGSIPLQQRLRAAEELHDAIFRPIQAQLSGKRLLTVVADGALHYVPFGVLHDKGAGRFVIQDRDIAFAPSVRTLFQRNTAQQQPTMRMLLVADPLYGDDDSRLARLRGGESDAAKLQRLPGTATEAQAIRQLFAANQIDMLEGAAATRERFLATDLHAYRFIHIASHAVADAEIPQLSALILSTVDRSGRPINGRVFAADLLSIRLNTDLLVLSGCETALGKNVAGEGLMGLQYVMLARGARAVVSSLWAVPDRETAQLMTSFYAASLERGLGPRAALGAAMRSMIAEKADPSNWSAFGLTTSVLRDSTTASFRGSN